MGSPTAWDEPDTRASWRRYVRAGLACLAVAAALFVAGWWADTTGDAEADELLRNGRRARGVVEMVDVGMRTGTRSLHVYYVVDGAPYRAKLTPKDESRGYKQGQAIEVLYNPADPSRIRTVEDPNKPTWVRWTLVTAAVGGGVLAWVGATVLWRARRWRRLLRREPWRKVDCKLLVHYFPRLQYAVRVADQGERAVAVLKWPLSPARLAGLYKVAMVGDVKRRALLSTAQRHLYEIRPTRSRWRQRRWEKEFDAAD